MVKRLLSSLTLIATATVAGTAFGQFDLSSTSATGAPGAAVQSSVILDNTGTDNVAGWSYGVCHDSAVATLDGAGLGATGLVVNNGDEPDFNQINVFTDGYTIGVVISFIGTAVLAPELGSELTVADYTLSGAAGAMTTLALCSDLGSPPVATVVVVNGQSVTPNLVEGTLEIEAGAPEGFIFSVADQTVDFPEATGFASFTSSFNVSEVGAVGGTVTQGFSMGLAHDGALLDATAIAATNELAALNGGAGPDFFGSQLLADGATLGCVYSFLGTDTIVFGDPGSDIVDVDYNTVVTDLIGDTTPTDTTLSFVSTLGSPPVDNVVVVGGQSVDPIEFVDGTITLNPISGPSLAIFVVGDTNQDGKKNVADPVYILNFLFAGGDPLDCPASGDADDDGMVMQNDAVLLLDHYFTGGAAPAGPYPSCGTRPGVEEADCTFDAAVCP